MVTINGTTGVDKVQDDAVNPVTDIASGIPCFSATRALSTQSITSATWTKIQFDTVKFDTTNAYDGTTNYRFQPLVAGYYKVIVSVRSTVDTTQLNVGVYKNGVLYKQNVLGVSSTAATSIIIEVIVSMNGTTDYIEGYGFITGTSPAFSNNEDRTYFQAHLIVGA